MIGWYRQARKWGIIGGSIGLASYFIYLLYYFLEAYVVGLVSLIFVILAVREIASEVNRKTIFQSYLVSVGASLASVTLEIIGLYAKLAAEVSGALLVVSFVFLSISAIFGLISFNMITKETLIGQFRIGALLSLAYVPIAALYLLTSAVAKIDIIVSLAGYLFTIGAFYSLSWVVSIPHDSRLPQDSASLPKAEHGFYRDYLFADEGVYRVELMSDEKRILSEYWGLFVLAAGLAQQYTLVTFFILLASLYLNKYLWRAIGNRTRAQFARGSASNEAQTAVRIIPWSGLKRVDLYGNMIAMTFVDGRSEKSTIHESDYERLRVTLPSKLGDRFLLKLTQGASTASRAAKV